MGMRMFFTSESTILPNAAPMITPTARSTTLPLKANFLNSSRRENAFCSGCNDLRVLIGSIIAGLLGLRGMHRRSWIRSARGPFPSTLTGWRANEFRVEGAARSSPHDARIGPRGDHPVKAVERGELGAGAAPEDL